MSQEPLARMHVNTSTALRGVSCRVRKSASSVPWQVKNRTHYTSNDDLVDTHLAQSVAAIELFDGKRTRIEHAHSARREYAGRD